MAMRLRWASLRGSRYPLLPATASSGPQVSAGPPFPPPAAPSFRPLPPQALYFSLLPNPSRGTTPPSLAYHNPSIPPPGVSSTTALAPGVASATGGIAVLEFVLHMQPMMSYQVPLSHPAIPTQGPPYAMPNCYVAILGTPQTAVPPAGGFCCFHSSTIYYC
ncbi:U1 small nuclear ribonucleoprotein C-like [Arachis ipaensis]|uniref:U1 small nuclear ribonucleoprotein C-like n=1 Tax=Arachis ipaensis TaxID=130454 RepID=UPI0007AF17D2|nr:U1 small nuclear ribonucleoprotein C-like [Arachis ipaensis]